MDKPITSKEEELSKTERKITKNLFKKSISQNKKKIILISITLLLVIIVFLAISKITINLSDELNIIITPYQQTETVYHSAKANITFDIQNDNLLQCNTLCNFTFIDQKSMIATYSSIETLKHGQKLKKSFQVNTPTSGSGQVLYSFKAKCHNIKTIICRTQEDERSTTSIAAVNYMLRDEEIQAKMYLKPKIEELSDLSKSARSKLNEININIFPQEAIEFAQLISLTKNQSKIVTDSEASSEKLMQLWELEDYLKLKGIFREEDLEQINETNRVLQEVRTSFENMTSIRNYNIKLLQSMENKKQALSEAMDFYESEGNLKNNINYASIINASEKIDESYNLISKNISHSEIQLKENLEKSITVLDDGVLAYKRTRARINSINLYGQKLLLLKNKTIINATLDCDGIRNIFTKIEDANLESEVYLLNNTINYTIPKEDTLHYIEYVAAKNSFEEITNSTNSDKEIILEEAIKKEIPTNKPTREEIIAATLNISEFELFLKNNCEDSAFNQGLDSRPLRRIISSKYLALETIKINQYINVTENLNLTILTEKPSICCALGSCEPCCNEGCEDKNYPVLFIHGHAFNNKNSPDYSLSLFNEIQENLEKEGYINLGEIDLNEETADQATWGRANHSATIKASYYYIYHYKLGDYIVSVQNDESIETYAIRLKEIIDSVKEKTGKQKVNLVAHSMGGLVARDYVLLFGEENINLLVTVNTPHKGISGRTLEWCGLFGSEKECEQMSENSIFLSRLNAKKISPDIPIYAFRSSGCKMDNGANGDGVVTNESAYYEGAYNYEVNGTCTDTAGTDLHYDILKPSKYPQMYKQLLEILEAH